MSALAAEERAALEARIQALAKENFILKKGVVDFLVPHRCRLAECWLDHFVDIGAVTFDNIGYVRAAPTPDYQPT